MPKKKKKDTTVSGHTDPTQQHSPYVSGSLSPGLAQSKVRSDGGPAAIVYTTATQTQSKTRTLSARACFILTSAG